jgi:hypothetical protein
LVAWADLTDGTIAARFAFTFDGVYDDYWVTVSTAPDDTYFLDTDFATPHAPSWVGNPVMLSIVPEPTTIGLLGFASLALFRRRRS